MGLPNTAPNGFIIPFRGDGSYAPPGAAHKWALFPLQGGYGPGKVTWDVASGLRSRLPVKAGLVIFLFAFGPEVLM